MCLLLENLDWALRVALGELLTMIAALAEMIVALNPEEN